MPLGSVRRRISINALQRRILEIQPELRKAVIRAHRDACHVLHALVVEQIDSMKAVDRGELKASVAYVRLPEGARVEVRAPHAAMVEFGTRPFRPPTAVLTEWVLRKGLTSDPKEAKRIAWAIGEKFSKEGIKPRAYFRTAWELVQPYIGEAIEREIAAETP